MGKVPKRRDDTMGGARAAGGYQGIPETADLYKRPKYNPGERIPKLSQDETKALIKERKEQNRQIRQRRGR